MKTARTSPRARKHAQRLSELCPCASALCWRPMAVPRRPHQLRAPRTTRGSRISTHAATRAPQHTSPAHLRLFAPCAGSADCFWHPTSGCTRTRRECDGSAGPGAHARPHARSLIRPVCCAQPVSLPAHTAYSTMCTHTLRRSPHPTTIACLTPHHAVSRTPPAARSEKLQRAPLHACTVSPLHSETFSFAPPPRLPGHSPQQ